MCVFCIGAFHMNAQYISLILLCTCLSMPSVHPTALHIVTLLTVNVLVSQNLKSSQYEHETVSNIISVAVLSGTRTNTASAD